MTQILTDINSPFLSKHELVLKIEEPSVGLFGFIAIHNRNLGEAVGGTRMYPYKSTNAALNDVLRLSEAMTYKCAIAGVPHGGGKAVIIANPEKDKTEALLGTYAEIINSLKGTFRTGEDVGISENDVQLMLQKSPYFIGNRDLAGDPSPYAAQSTFVSIQKAISIRTGKNTLAGVSVAVKGVGKVGSSLVDLLKSQNAQVIVADKDPKAVAMIQRKYNDITVMDYKEIQTAYVDVYAPCAMGNEFNEENVTLIRAKIICGAANNQLASPEIGIQLYKQGITYIPDYVANAGGLIDVVDELEPDGYHRARVLERIEKIKDTVATIISLSDKKKLPINIISDQISESIFLNKNVIKQRNAHSIYV